MATVLPRKLGRSGKTAARPFAESFSNYGTAQPSMDQAPGTFTFGDNYLPYKGNVAPPVVDSPYMESPGGDSSMYALPTAGINPMGSGDGIHGAGGGAFGYNPMSSLNPPSAKPYLQSDSLPNFSADAGPTGGMFSGIGDWAKSSGMFGSTDTKTGIKTDGWGNMALGGLQAGAGLYMGMQQYGLAKDQLAEGKRQYNQNYDNQRKMTNSRLEDRQRARVASNSGAYESVDAYMAKNRIA